LQCLGQTCPLRLQGRRVNVRRRDDPHLGLERRFYGVVACEIGRVQRRSLGGVRRVSFRFTQLVLDPVRGGQVAGRVVEIISR